MTMFPHTVTLYSPVRIATGDITRPRWVNQMTILKGVMLDASKAVNVIQSGLVDADSVELYIPYDVIAVDGAYADDIDNAPRKRYVGPIEYGLAEDKSEIWTLRANGNDFFIKGIAVEDEEATRQLIDMKYDNVYGITSVDDLDYGGLKHFEVGGK